MRLHHVQVSCPPGGEDAARRFYGDGLGMAEVAKPAALAGRGGVWFRTVGEAVGTVGTVGTAGTPPSSGPVSPAGAVDHVDAAEIHVGVEQEFRPAKKAHPALAVDDIDAVASRLRAHGYATDWDDLFPGYRRFYTADGNGNRVEILQPSHPEPSARPR